MSSDIVTLIVDEGYDGVRIDKYLALYSEGFSRSYIQKLIKEGNILLNDVPVSKTSLSVRVDDTIIMHIPEPKELNIEPEDLKLEIIYEDNDIIIVNKPKGMVVHPSAGHYTGTLVNGLLYHCKDSLSSINGILRPGIVHRIDMDTSGLLVVCKNDEAHRSIAAQLKEHSIERTYHAIVYNNITEGEGTVDAPIGRSPSDRKKMAVNYKNGKPAVTHYKVLERFGDLTYIKCNLETGRTHQIRVHMASINHPLLGDFVYGPEKNRFGVRGQVLHAKSLGFIHPSTHEYMQFDSEIPEYFAKILEKLAKQ